MRFLITNILIPVNLSTFTLFFLLLLLVFSPITDQLYSNLVKNIYCKAKLYLECLNTIYDLEKNFILKSTNLQKQNLASYQAVLSFLKIQI